MYDNFFTDEHYFNKNFSELELPIADYEGCSFENCNFSGCDLSQFKFIECDFNGCDLSNCKLVKTSFQDCHFLNCKLIGLNFDQCESFSFSFSAKDSMFDHSGFYGVKLKKARILNCSFQNADLSACDLSGSDLSEGNFKGAIFDQTNLEKANLRQAKGYLIDPEINKIKGALFSLPEVTALLDKYELKIE